MAKQLFSNNGSAQLAASISDSDLTIQVQSGFGALYPDPGDDEFFLVTLENDDGDIEIVKVSARASDLLTVPSGGRGQEGTSAQSWTNGQARVECRITAGTLEAFLQRAGDEVEGDFNFNENEIQDVILTGANTRIEAGEIVGVPLRGTSGDASNEIAVPDDGSRATAGGEEIVVAGDTENIRNTAFAEGMIMMWYGAALDCPEGWAICDGNDGTPDLRNKFVVGAGDTYVLNDDGGAASATTDSQGDHTHTSSSGEHTLTTDEIPAHVHSMPTQLFVDEIDNGTGKTYVVNGSGMATGSAGGGQPHSHPDGTTDSQGAHTHTVDTLPPFKALYYIIFVGVA